MHPVLVHVVLSVLAIAGITSAASQSSGTAAVARELAAQHPAEYYRRAAALFSEGKKDDAVFIFYLGQLRYRTHLAARPDLPADRDRALFASLSEVVGRPINEFAFHDIPALASTIDGVLAWDQRNPDSFTPPMAFPGATATVRKGLAAMKATILADADKIRAQRKANGLPNSP